MNSLDACFSSLQLNSGSPTVVIADTRRGKGLPSIEERADRWFCNFSAEETQALIEELNGHARATLTSETLIVR
jgi:transketolase